MFESFLIVVLDLKIIQSLLERVQICNRCWETEASTGHGGFF